MEIIAAIIIYALAEDIKDNKAMLLDVQDQIVNLNNDFLKLSGAHSSLSARHRVDHDTHHAKIDKINKTLETIKSN